MELAFEDFAKKLCEKVICPNLLEQTGPVAGGDGKVDTQPLQLDGHSIHCTASFGISSLVLPQINHPDEAQTLLETLFNNADQAMMQAKRAGRNQVNAIKNGHLI
ncbi:diguanylate cyclase domain-containing protein [Shewanella mangrovisoli]|uniref:diguanylate cyclase domain-containing protein n=1 Tax=Shewanella mangrovisoli TaxID=2864211 RepID=UPI0035BA0D5F